MRRALLLAMALLGMTLAGCSDEQPEPLEPGPVPDEVERGKGVIRGVVFDPSITPVVGATVEVGETEFSGRTDADGAFLFVDVEPGTYFLTVSKPGWASVQQGVEVVADERAPPVVKVRLQRVPGSEPLAQTVQGTGFIACSVGHPLRAEDCSAEGQQTTVVLPVGGRPDWIQTEVVWDSTQPSGDNLYVIQEVCPRDGCPAAGLQEFPNRFDESADAVSPHVARADPAFLDSVWLEAGDFDLLVDLTASGPALGTGVALDQEFTVYATFFYNLEPGEGWTFLQDGAHPTPE